MFKKFVLVLLILLFAIFVFGGQETEAVCIDHIQTANSKEVSPSNSSTYLNSIPVYCINNSNFV